MGKKFLAILSAFVVSIFVANAGYFVNAQNSGQGLEIAPPLVDLKADPGQTIKTQIRVRNVTKDTLIVKAQFEDFVASGEDGQPKILLKEGETSPYSIKSWLSAPESVKLAPNQRESIEVTINVPKNAGPGGHYGVVRFTGTPPELEGTGVSLSASVGTLVLVNVSGNVKQSAKVVELFASKNGKRGSLFEYGPLTVTTRVQNDGNVHFKPKGTVQVTNMLGKNVVVGQFNQEGRNVLPSSIRKFEQTIDKKFMFGRYTIKADIVYGTENQITTAKSTFWVIPYKIITIVILAIILLIFIIKRYNKFIIKLAEKKQSDGSKTKSKKDKN